MASGLHAGSEAPPSEAINLGFDVAVTKGSQVELRSVEARHSSNVDVVIGVSLREEHSSLGIGYGPPQRWVTKAVKGTVIRSKNAPYTGPFLVISAYPLDGEPWSIDELVVKYWSGHLPRTEVVKASFSGGQ